MIQTFTFKFELEIKHESIALHQTVIGRFRVLEVLSYGGFGVTDFKFLYVEPLTNVALVAMRTKKDATKGRVEVIVIEDPP